MGYITASGLWNEAVVGELLEARVDGGLNLVIHPRKRPINSVSKIELWRGTNSMSLNLTDSNGNTRYHLPDPKSSLVYPSSELEISASTYAIASFADVKYSDWYTKIDYIGGYTLIPLDIAEATTLLTSDTFMRHANKEGLMSLTQGRVTKTWQSRFNNGRENNRSDLEEQAYRTLDHYKIASGYF